jgi:phosphatidylglycerol:prolipoprotein diacylglycerol transferase
MLTYPQIDPVLLTIGPLVIRWYSLAYIGGIVLGAWYIQWLNKKTPVLAALKPFDDLMFWAIIGIIVGGRLGYVFFYYPDYFLSHPAEIIQIWQGGMSFHGGLVGFALAVLGFCKKNHYPFFSVMDLCAAAAPIGIFFGRMANFINGELYGRTTTFAFGMIFPNGGPLPRHPSQLYEAVLEGIATFLILFVLAHFFNFRRHVGALTGSFLCCYSLSRIYIEQFREPDEEIGFIIGHITMGQLLSLPMLAVGLGLLYLAFLKRPDSHVRT